MKAYLVGLEQRIKGSSVILANSPRSAAAKWIHSKCDCVKEFDLNIQVVENVDMAEYDFFRYRPMVDLARLQQFPRSFEESGREQ